MRDQLRDAFGAGHSQVVADAFTRASAEQGDLSFPIPLTAVLPRRHPHTPHLRCWWNPTTATTTRTC